MFSMVIEPLPLPKAYNSKSENFSVSFTDLQFELSKIASQPHILVKHPNGATSYDQYCISAEGKNYKVLNHTASDVDGLWMKFRVMRHFALNGLDTNTFSIQRILDSYQHVSFRYSVEGKDGEYIFKTELSDLSRVDEKVRYLLDQEVAEALKVGILMHKLKEIKDAKVNESWQAKLAADAKEIFRVKKALGGDAAPKVSQWIKVKVKAQEQQELEDWEVVENPDNAEEVWTVLDHDST